MSLIPVFKHYLEKQNALEIKHKNITYKANVQQLLCHDCIK